MCVHIVITRRANKPHRTQLCSQSERGGQAVAIGFAKSVADRREAYYDSDDNKTTQLQLTHRKTISHSANMAARVVNQRTQQAEQVSPVRICRKNGNSSCLSTVANNVVVDRSVAHAPLQSSLPFTTKPPQTWPFTRSKRNQQWTQDDGNVVVNANC